MDSRFRITLIAIIAALMNFIPEVTSTRAASRLTDDLTELLKLAKVVAEVEVLTQTNQPESKAQVPVTVVTLKIHKIFKGDLLLQSELTAEYLGGFDGHNQVVVPGQPVLVPGLRAVVLLSNSVDPSARWHVLAGDAGQINFGQNEKGESIASRTSGGQFEYFVRDEQSLTGYSPVKSTWVSSACFYDLLSAILATGRPVLDAGYKSRPAPMAVSASSKFQAAREIASSPVTGSQPTERRTGGEVEGSPLVRLLGVVLFSVVAVIVIRHRRGRPRARTINAHGS